MTDLPIEGRRVAIVGGAGFIGHHLALRLKSLGADVHVIDSLQVNNLGAVSSRPEDENNRGLYVNMINERLKLLRDARVPLYIEDVREYSVVSRTLSYIAPQVIIHLAAVAHANRSNKDPHSTFDHSLRTLENVLDYSRSGGVEHFIYFSSSMVYGNFQEELVTEDTPCEPLGIYGALKFAGEKITIAYNQVFDLTYTIIRPSALYGERCVSRRVGQVFIENLMQGKPLTVSGDGEDRLDFTYIGDVVNGITKIIGTSASYNQVFNLTFGNSRSINQMIGILQDRFPPFEVEYIPRDKLMPERGTLSVDKARELVGYEPEWPLEQGFVQYVDWYKSFIPNQN